MRTQKHHRLLAAKVLLVIALVLGNVYIAGNWPVETTAHIGGTHFHKGGTQVHFGIWNNAGVVDGVSYQNAAQNALSNQYTNISLLYWNYATSHTEISVYTENFPGEGCGGHIPFDTDATHRYHSHSYYNRDCGSDLLFARGIFCQEVGHAWSQNHHTIGNGCMGLTYGSTGSTQYYITSHDNTDFTNFYRCHLGCPSALP